MRNIGNTSSLIHSKGLRLIYGCVSVLFLFASVAQACTCLDSPSKQFRGAKKIVEGQVLTVGAEQRNQQGWLRIPLTLRLSKTWKGSAEKEMSVWTSRTGPCSAFTFEKGEDYLFYVDKNGFVTSDCNSSMQASSEVAVENKKRLRNWWFRLKARLHLN